MIKTTLLIFGVSFTAIFIIGIFIGMTSVGDDLKSFSTQLNNYVPNTQEKYIEIIPSIPNEITFED